MKLLSIPGSHRCAARKGPIIECVLWWSSQTLSSGVRVKYPEDCGGNICNRNNTKVCPRMLACRRACPCFRLGRCCAAVTPWPTDDSKKHSQQEWERMPNGDHSYMRKTACFQPLRCLLSEDSYRIRRFSCRHQHRNVQWLWWHRCCASPSLTKSQPRGRRWLCVLLLAMGNW